MSAAPRSLYLYLKTIEESKRKCYVVQNLGNYMCVRVCVYVCVCVRACARVCVLYIYIPNSCKLESSENMNVIPP